MSIVDTGMEVLIEWGLANVILPFILIFVLCYGMLRKTKIFGKDGASYDMLISFCLAFFTIHNYAIADNLSFLISRVAIFFVFLIGLMLLSGMVGVHQKYSKGIAGVVIAIYLAYTVMEIWFKDITFNLNQTIVFTGTTIAIFGFIVWFIVRPTSGGQTSSSTNSSSSSKQTRRDTKSKSIPKAQAPTNTQNQTETQENSQPTPPPQKQPPENIFKELENRGAQLKRKS